MISFEQALAVVENSVIPKDVEKVCLCDALGRILSCDVCLDQDLPRVNLSAMDGFACRQPDLDKELQEVETIPAGRLPQKQVGPGECARIMTGAIVPEGADTVVMFENTHVCNGRVRVIEKTKKTNIRYRGEEGKKGMQVLAAGTKVTPATIAILASVGQNPVPVFKKTKVGIVSTGDELIESAAPLQPGQIRNSNGPQLFAQILEAGCEPCHYGVAKDTPEAIDHLLKLAMKECDVVLLTGGVSTGDFDFVPSVLKQNQIDLKFEHVAIKPGKPTVFGVKGRQFVFGLPGNPVSTFVIFEILVKPLLARLMGHKHHPRHVRTSLGQTICRQNTDRLEFRPVWFDDKGVALLIDYQGSAHIHAYAKAQGMIRIPVQVSQITQGSEIDVTLI